MKTTNILGSLFVLLTTLTLAANVLAQTSTPVPKAAASATGYTCLKAETCLNAKATGSDEPQCAGVAAGSKGHTARLWLGQYDKVQANTGGVVVQAFATPDGMKPTTGSCEVDNSWSLQTCIGGSCQCNYNYLARADIAALKVDSNYLKDKTGTVVITQPKLGEAFPPQLMSDAKESVGPFQWADQRGTRSQNTLSSSFYFMYRYNPVATLNAGSGQQSQGTFSFSASADQCSLVKWDPKGTVFDSKSLDPIPNVNVKVQRVDENGVAHDDLCAAPTPGVESQCISVANQQTTGNNGKYSFYLDTGKYWVTLPGTTGFPAVLTDVNENWNKVYGFAEKATTSSVQNLYVQDSANLHWKDINEVAGKVEVRDVPVNANYKATVGPNGEIPEAQIKWEAHAGPTIRVDGSSPYPLTEIKVYASRLEEPLVTPPPGSPTLAPKYVQTRYLFTTCADRHGSFDFHVAKYSDENDTHMEGIRTNSKDKEVSINLAFKKVDIAAGETCTPSSATQAKVGGIWSLISNLMSNIIPAVEAQTARAAVQIPAIPTYLEGCAYDAKGNKLPNAQIQIVPDFSTAPSYTTKADATGCFKVSSEYLPGTPYSLAYKTSTGVLVKDTVVSFMNKNQTYQQQNKVNPFIYKNAQGQVINAPAQNNGGAAGGTGSTPGGGTGSTDTNNPSGNTPGTGILASNNSSLLLIVVLLVVIGIAGTVFAIHLLKKNQQPPY